VGLGSKLQAYTAEEEGLYAMLLEAGQGHIFEAWPPQGQAEERKHAFFKQVGE
jgi:hypothetical protein